MEKKGQKIPPGYPRTNLKIPGFFHGLNPGIFYPGIFQEPKSRDFLVPGFFDPGISRDIPGPGYPVDIPSMHDRLLGITEYFLLCAVGYAAAMFLSCHTLTCKNHFGSAYVKLSFYLHFEGKTFLRAFVIALNFSANCFSRKRTQWLECKIGHIFYKMVKVR